MYDINRVNIVHELQKRNITYSESTWKYESLSLSDVIPLLFEMQKSS